MGANCFITNHSFWISLHLELGPCFALVRGRLDQTRRTRLDATRFDAWTKRLLTTRLTRGHTLRGIAVAGIAAVTGGRLVPEGGAAKKRKQKHTRRVCHCGSSPTNCRTKKGTKTQVKRHIRKHPCDYKGRCRSTNPRCPGTPCKTITDCSGGQACVKGFCGTCTNGNQCAAGQGCNAGVCGPCTALNQCADGLVCTVGGICVAPGATCTAGACPAPLVCVGNVCVLPSTCTPACVAPLVCVGGVCVLPGTGCTPATCALPLVCLANICVQPTAGCTPANCAAPRSCLPGIGCVEQCTGTGSGTCSGGLTALCLAGICVAI